MNIVYFVFGENIIYYQQAFFSIYTSLAQKSEQDRIILITEQPSYFAQLGDWVTVLPITKDTIENWKGDYNYFFRVKIKALEFISEQYPDKHILYLDGDTFVYKSLSSIKQGLDQGKNYLHLNEGPLPSLKTKTEKKLWKQIGNRSFGGIAITKNTCMWNSGVIGISREHFAAIPLALQITDHMCQEKVTCFTMEQLSFGIACNEFSNLQSSDDIVGHYWGNKLQWDQVISNWMSKCLLTGISREQMVEQIKDFPFQDYPFYVKRSNTQQRLVKRLDKLFKQKNHKYI